MDRVPPPRARRVVLTTSHWIAIVMAAVVVSTVGVVALVLTQAQDPGPPEGTYRLVARDSALCLAAASTSGSTPSNAAMVPSQAVRLSACPDAGEAWGAAAGAPAVVTGRAPGLGDFAVDGDDPADPMDVRWSMAADGTRVAFHPADGSDLCLAVTGRASVYPVALEPCRASGTQTWTLRQVGRSDYFQVVADQGRRCLGAVTIDGTVTAVEKMCSSEPSQQWRFDPAD